MSVVRWWWVRHAPVEAAGSVLHGRRSDPSIGPVGEPSWRAVALELPAGAHWITSSQRRAAETAARLLAVLGGTVVPEIDADLAEQDFGDWDGRPVHEGCGALGPDDPFWEDPGGSPAPGGESFAELALRVAGRVRRSTIERPGTDIVAVAHAGTIRAALALALELSPGSALRLEIAPLSLTRIDAFLQNGRLAGWRVAMVNRLPSY